MAIDLLDLISKNSSLVGLDPTFSGLVAPTAPMTAEAVASGGDGTSGPATRSIEGLTAGQVLGIAGPVVQSLIGSMFSGNPLSLAKTVAQTAAQMSEDPYAAPGMIGQMLDSFLNDGAVTYYGDIFQDPSLPVSTGLVNSDLQFALAMGLMPADFESAGGSDSWGGLGDIGSGGDFSNTDAAGYGDAGNYGGAPSDTN